jgi:hypothetical protein
MNYLDFFQAPLANLFTVNTCEPSDTPGLYQMRSTSTCASTGSLFIGIYDDDACTNLLASESVWANDCQVHDDDGDAEDDYDDDDYELVDVINSEFCT